jgi:glycosyltransferase involved in cell wall biosynthesis
MKKILWISDSPLTSTSYGKVTHELCRRIGKELEIHVLSFLYYGKSLRGENYFIHSYEDARSLAISIETLKPDYVVWIGDTMIMNDILKINLGSTKFIPYSPCDGYPILYGSKPIFDKAFKILATSKYTKKVLKECGYDSTVLYHGVDTNIFKPSNVDKKTYGIENDKFVFFHMGVNSGRKMIWRLIQSFHEFSKDKDDAILLVRTIPENPDGDNNLVEFTKFRFPELFEKKKLYFSLSNMFSPVPDEYLAGLYNACDVYVSTSSGEGFGMPYIESMACKKPVIAPNNTSTPELITQEIEGIGPRGIATKIDTYATDMKYFIDKGICSIEDTVRAMNILYEDKKKRDELGENGLKFVKKFCNWDEISKKLLEILS